MRGKFYPVPKGGARHTTLRTYIDNRDGMNINDWCVSLMYFARGKFDKFLGSSILLHHR